MPGTCDRSNNRLRGKMTEEQGLLPRKASSCARASSASLLMSVEFRPPRSRFECGMQSTRPGAEAPRNITEAQVGEVVTRTLDSTPAQAMHCNIR
jgi:hypothetical protein